MHYLQGHSRYTDTLSDNYENCVRDHQAHSWIIIVLTYLLIVSLIDFVNWTNEWLIDWCADYRPYWSVIRLPTIICLLSNCSQTMRRTLVSLVAAALCSLPCHDQTVKAECSNPPPGVSTMVRGVDITKLDIVPLQIIGSNGFMSPVLNFTCGGGRKWTNPAGVEYQLPDQVSLLSLFRNLHA